MNKIVKFRYNNDIWDRPLIEEDEDYLIVYWGQEPEQLIISPKDVIEIYDDED